ncbi:MAG TPA: hypothetical protein VFT66_16050 [Roseiflexaceae bacterium]|nr:hypothetical protein [Roseiflexaceae bacterium]
MSHGGPRSVKASFIRLRTLVLALMLVGVNMPFGAQAAPFALGAQPVAAASIQDTPTPLVPSGVNDYTLASPKLFWHARDCTPFIGSQPNGTEQAKPSGTALVDAESISRIATSGSAPRTLYSVSANGYCGALPHSIASNIVADADYLYWLTDQGLMRLSTSANVGDAPQVFNSSAATSAVGSVAISSDKVYAMPRHNSPSSIFAVDKATGAATTVTSNLSVNAGSLSFDGTYLYAIDAGVLKRITTAGAITPIQSNVSSYYAEGARTYLCGINPIRFCTSRNVYFSIGNTISVYDNETNNTSPIYTGGTGSTIGSMTTTSGILGGGYLLFFENLQGSCSPFACPTPVLRRTSRGGGAADALYTSQPGSSTSNLTTDGTFLFWQEYIQNNSIVQRLPVNASALPQINMRVTGMEVTQGIQNLSNSVLLVKNKRTFVRLYVKSDGAAVAGVKAQLSSRLGSLQPVNSVGTMLTVRTTPSRNDINQSFLFELPWSWTQQNSLTLIGTLNPYKVPLEPNYGDDTASVTATFKDSPTLSAEFFRLNYVSGGTSYQPRIFKDVLQTYSWILRAYPIGGAVGQYFKPRLWDVAGDTRLGNWVNQSSSDCNSVQHDQGDRSLCASYYTNGWLKYYRDHAWVPNTNDFYYGMIADGAAFPRGQAMYNKTSVGPAGSGTWGWDTDGSYADWYAGHEMGHTLGRAHPTASAATCGNSASDNNYPYPGGQIGPNDGSMEGFDAGDPTFGIAKAVYPGTSWYDVMSYCSNQWISDYTYTGMYNYMIAHPSSAPTAGTLSADATRSRILVDGDFLSVSGVISPTGGTAGFAAVYHLSSVANQPPLTPGDYSIRLLDGANGTLATYSFTPTPSDDGTGLTFDQVVNFVAGTRTVQIIRNSDNTVLGSHAISANPPTVSNVALQGAPNPVSGVVTLAWTASDPDGDALTFDIFYSRDNGATFQPVKMNVTGSSTQIDTAQLGGSGTAILRVAANDGVNTGEASSAPFVMAPKPPQPYILSPGDNLHIHYGQLVNFNGMAFDPQDGTIADAGLSWSSDKAGALGTGALVSSDSLPVGVNKITLTATNSVGQSATATVTVIVDDDLNAPGPTLSAGPGQVGWHVAAGTTTPQTAQVTISNAGGGSMDWTASSNQSWLTTDVVTGTVTADGDPSTLTLTANPAGLENNKIYTATLTITKPATSDSDPAQTIVIPVSLSIGDTWNLPAENLPPSVKIYLPLIRR